MKALLEVPDRRRPRGRLRTRPPAVSVQHWRARLRSDGAGDGRSADRTTRRWARSGDHPWQGRRAPSMSAVAANRRCTLELPVAGASREWLAQLLHRTGQWTVPPRLRSSIAADVAPGTAPTLAARPLCMEEDRTDEGVVVATCHPTPSMAGPAVCRQTPEVGAPCSSGHAGICAGGAGKAAFLPQLGAAGGELPAATRRNARPYMLPTWQSPSSRALPALPALAVRAGPRSD